MHINSFLIKNQVRAAQVADDVIERQRRGRRQSQSSGYDEVFEESSSKSKKAKTSRSAAQGYDNALHVADELVHSPFKIIDRLTRLPFELLDKKRSSGGQSTRRRRRTRRPMRRGRERQEKQERQKPSMFGADAGGPVVEAGGASSGIFDGLFGGSLFGKGGDSQSGGISQGSNIFSGMFGKENEGIPAPEGGGAFGFSNDVLFGGRKKKAANEGDIQEEFAESGVKSNNLLFKTFNEPEKSQFGGFLKGGLFGGDKNTAGLPGWLKVILGAMGLGALFLLFTQGDKIGGVIEGIKSFFTEGLVPLFLAFGKLGQEVVGIAAPFLRQAIEGLTVFLGDPAIRSGLQALAGVLSSAVGYIWDKISNLLLGVFEFFQKPEFEEAVGYLAKFAGGLIEIGGKVLGTVFSGIITLINWLGRRFGKRDYDAAGTYNGEAVAVGTAGYSASRLEKLAGESSSHTAVKDLMKAALKGGESDEELEASGVAINSIKQILEGNYEGLDAGLFDKVQNTTAYARIKNGKVEWLTETEVNHGGPGSPRTQMGQMPIFQFFSSDPSVFPSIRKSAGINPDTEKVEFAEYSGEVDSKLQGLKIFAGVGWKDDDTGNPRIVEDAILPSMGGLVEPSDGSAYIIRDGQVIQTAADDNIYAFKSDMSISPSGGVREYGGISGASAVNGENSRSGVVNNYYTQNYPTLQRSNSNLNRWPA